VTVSTFFKTSSGKAILRLFAVVLGVLIVLGGDYVLRARWKPEVAHAAITRAQDFLKQGQPASALTAVAKVPDHGPWESDLLTVKGLAMAALDRPEAVRPLLERAVRLDPKQAMAIKVLAAVYFATNETERGFDMLQQSVRLNPRDFRPWFATGDMIMKFHLPPADAVRAFKNALRLKPDHEESVAGLIDALLTMGSIDEATPLIEAALKQHPDDPRLLYLAALHARFEGRLEDMNRFAVLSLQHDPNNAQARVLCAQYLHRVGRSAEALTQAEEAVLTAPNDLAGLSLLAQIESSLGMNDRSAATTNRHLKTRTRTEQMGKFMEEMRRRPEDPEPRWRMGQIAAESGMTAMAIGSYQAALALDPHCKPALDGLAVLNVSSNQASIPAAQR